MGEFLSLNISFDSRFISPEDLRWAVGTGRFFFHKDTESKKEAIRAKVEAVKEVKGACTSFR